MTLCLNCSGSGFYKIVQGKFLLTLKFYLFLLPFPSPKDRGKGLHSRVLQLLCKKPSHARMGNSSEVGGILPLHATIYSLFKILSSICDFALIKQCYADCLICLQLHA